MAVHRAATATAFTFNQKDRWIRMRRGQGNLQRNGSLRAHNISAGRMHGPVPARRRQDAPAVHVSSHFHISFHCWTGNWTLQSRAVSPGLVLRLSERQRVSG